MTSPGTTEGDGLGGVFFLHGEDEFRKDEHARALVDAHLEPSTADFNFDRLRGAETDFERLATVLGTPPMMADWRVVVLRDVEALATSVRARDLLLETAGSPPPGLALILLATPPSRAQFYQDLGRLCRTTEYRPLHPNDVPGWLMARARQAHGMELDEEAARALAAGIGADLGVLAQELQKLAAVAAGSTRITAEHVEQAGTRLPSQDRWKWFDLVGERRFAQALQAVPVLLAQGEDAVGLGIGLATHLLRVGVAAEQGTRALEQTLPPHQRWIASRVGAQARRWTGAEVETAILGLLRVDRLKKSGRLSDQHLLEEWLLVRLALEGSAA